jgi:hypothetical protein
VAPSRFKRRAGAYSSQQEWLVRRYDWGGESQASHRLPKQIEDLIDTKSARERF